ncbi:SlyX family protein [Comamonas sp. NoAH]|uniref:SlyX family protein n=1 Tax=Comamonas halotolerans TaxID=3041496 RepID=UPI0024E08FEF|nr:SlyX family protein [Comamonas sp. NoAH]
MSESQSLEALEARVMDLEVKASYADDLLEQLNMTIYRQQQQLDVLINEVRQLRQQVPEGGQSAPRNLRDELPPHY